MEGKDIELDVYEVELRFIEEWLENPMSIGTPAVAIEDEKNATLEVAVQQCKLPESR